MGKQKKKKAVKAKVVSLFSGAGGMDLGIEIAGGKIIYANDNDPDCCKSLRKNFPKTEVVEDDIKNISSFPKADLVVGGYPCQSFSLAGNRNPKVDRRTYLYLEFARALKAIKPKFFIAENVSGLAGVKGGKFFRQQLKAFRTIGNSGYKISRKVVTARDFGIPQIRRRVFIIGVRGDQGLVYQFPEETHGKPNKKKPNLKPYTSHGEAIKDLPLWPEGEFYERPHDPKGNFSWYYMSRNRKAKWDEPSYTIVANWRHITLHPASPVMELVWSDLKNRWKQKWKFSKKYEHTVNHPERLILKHPRRLSWRECARIQTFPDDFVFEGKTESKINQIGNAVPPELIKIIVEGIITGESLIKESEKPKHLKIFT